MPMGCWYELFKYILNKIFIVSLSDSAGSCGASPLMEIVFPRVSDDHQERNRIEMDGTFLNVSLMDSKKSRNDSRPFGENGATIQNGRQWPSLSSVLFNYAEDPSTTTCLRAQNEGPHQSRLHSGNNRFASN